MDDNSRRTFLTAGGIGLAGLAITACSRSGSNSNGTANDKKSADPKEVTAAEDLMREHGVLRRALLVFSTAAMRLRKEPTQIAPVDLQNTARLFRTFGEDYHERLLEEAYIFPTVSQAAAKMPEAAKYVSVLLAQHDRGREITDYILSVTGGMKINAEAARLADTLDAFVLMYQHHAAREDTIIFPAWKGAISGEKYDELNDKFEDIEHQQFGEDGFADAVDQISKIETNLGIADIAQFTPPSPAAATPPASNKPKPA